ncbi:hypothetical protein [Nostoc sp. WHI]|uniref:hypothetical protein n=1 Tax=Nostoc sp. WHI TaxID=2650611 RepID=UPI0018C69BCF|nr:hypothetical protein [Nostoc sp. WHI]MBG1271590.1 hypothetical protein [Nostoc sp. WHI]
MVESYQGFPHIDLKLTDKGTAKSLGGGGNKKVTQTHINLSNRQGHGSKIQELVSSLISDWKITQQQQEEDKKLILPDSIPLILQIDPETFDLDDLRTSEIEIISELEDGYIIGASADTNLTELQKKIEKFFNEQQGGGVIAKILNILDKNQRPEFILSPKLLEEWEQIKDEQVYVVEVGISCLGTTTKLRDYPEQKNYKKPENYVKAINNWIDNRDITYDEWDDLASKRQQDLMNFISNPKYKYNGKLLSSFIEDNPPQFSEAPDSFSCLIQISGLCLKDLVFNFSYIFEVTEKDNIAEPFSPNGEISNISNISLFLQPPEKNAPNVCVIDSGIQEQNPLYQVKLPNSLRSPGEEFDIIIEITLSYKAEPRRTRRNRRKYLSTWLDWECSKQGEDPKHFLGRVLANYNVPKDADKGDELFTWTLGKEKHYKTIKNVSRSVGTIQKDWAFVKSYNLRDAFCIAVVGHEGWNNDPYAEVPYSLVVSFEATQTDIPIYTPLVEAQVETEIQPLIEI